MRRACLAAGFTFCMIQDPLKITWLFGSLPPPRMTTYDQGMQVRFQMKVSPLYVAISSVFTIVCLLPAPNLSLFSSEKDTRVCLPTDLQWQTMESSSASHHSVPGERLNIWTAYAE